MSHATTLSTCSVHIANVMSSFRSSRESQILFRRDRGIIPAKEESCILLPGISMMYSYSICSICNEFLELRNIQMGNIYAA